MALPVQHTESFFIDNRAPEITSVIQQIRECHNLAEAAFSGRPVSLCKSLERRGEMRVRLEEAIYLNPVEVDGNSATCMRTQPIVGIAQDISNHGVGVSYDEPITTDHLLAEFDLFGQGAVRLVVEIRWRKKLENHSFAAGGLVVGIARHKISNSRPMCQPDG